jgi:hypothetical protein
MRYVPAGPAAAPSDVDALHPRRSTGRKLQMSRTFTDFSSPSKGPMEVGSPERMQNQIRSRPWTAQPATRPWPASVPPSDGARDGAHGARGSGRAASSSAGGAAVQAPAQTDAAGVEAGGVSHRPGLMQSASRKAPGRERRRPSSAHPAPPVGHQSRDSLRGDRAMEHAVATVKRPSSAGFAQPSAVAGIFRSPDSRRPASANRISFDSDRTRAPSGAAAAHDEGGVRRASEPSQRPSSATSRPSSASARRKLEQATLILKSSLYSDFV